MSYTKDLYNLMRQLENPPAIYNPKVHFDTKIW